MSLLTGGQRAISRNGSDGLENTLDLELGLLRTGRAGTVQRLGVFPGRVDLEAAEAVGGARGSADGAKTDPERSSTRWAPWWMPAWSATRSVLAGRASRCWRLSASTPANGCARTASGTRHTTGVQPFLELAESAGPGWKVPARWPGWTGWKPSTLTSAPRSPGSWTRTTGPALQLSGMTWQYWWLRGHTEENARYGEVIVANGEKLPPGQLGYAQIGLGVLRILSGGKARVQVLFEQALALFRRLGDKRGIAIAAGYQGHLAALRGDYGKAGQLLTESLASLQNRRRRDRRPHVRLPRPDPAQAG